jgi:4-amino-4-deoxy-L-arabinose transferase-like glycosyltransferase
VSKRSSTGLLALAVILLAAAGLRLYRLDSLPPGPYYDEAANGILAAEIASGQSHPLFITSYTGKEVLYFYLAAAVMKVLGVTLFSLRLTSALIGIASVAVTYALARELFAGEGEDAGRGMAVLSAALMAVNFWHMAISRYGFRAISQPLLQGLALLFFWRATRSTSSHSTSSSTQARWGSAVLGGLFCGLTAYTYLSSRIVPLALLPWVAGAWLAAERGPARRQVAARIGVFLLVAAVTAAPLGVFFLRHPERFSARMDQVSVFNPELNRGDLWGTLGRSVAAALGMFTVRGDPQSRFGVIGRPVFDPVVGVFFYLGVLLALVRAVRGPRGRGARARGPRARDRVLYLSLLIWVPLLLVPSVLGVKEVPHSLRAIGVMPILFFFPALGICGALRGLSAAFTRWGWGRPAWLTSWPAILVLGGLLLVEGGILAGWDYFGVWGRQAAPYYENDNDMADAARTLNGMDLGERQVFVCSEHYRHPTMAFLAEDYARLRWLVGEQVLVFPPAGGPGAIYVFPHSSVPHPALLDLLAGVSYVERYLGPDGGTAYLIYTLPPGVAPPVAPQVETQIDFGHQVELLGYDLPPAAAGEPLAVTLYWRVLAPPAADDVLVFAHLRDAWGLHWGGSDEFDYPSAEWSPGQVIVQRREIPLPAAAPPGQYEVLVGMASRGQDARLSRLDTQGRVAGTTATLGPVQVEVAAAPPVELPAMQRALEASFGALRLLGVSRDRVEMRQGEVWYASLLWQAEGRLPDLDVALSLEPAAGGEARLLWRGRPVHGTYSTADWPAGAVVLDRYDLALPQDAPGGSYTLRLEVLDHESGQPAGDPVALSELRIEEVDRRTIVPPIQYPRQANLGAQVEFLGYDLDRDEVAPGETLHLTLYWRALAPMEASYTVFTHLLDGANQIRAQQDNPPQGGSYPTTLWAPGEVVADPYALTVQADAPAGPHVIEVGLYLAETGQRLPVLDAAGRVSGDRILVHEVEVR